MKSENEKSEKKIYKNFFKVSRSTKFIKIKKFIIYFLYFGSFISIISIPMNSSIILLIEGPGTKDIFYFHFNLNVFLYSISQMKFM